MKKDPFKITSKIIYLVVIFHLTFIIYLMAKNKFSFSKKKSPLVVHNVVIKPEPKIIPKVKKKQIKNKTPKPRQHTPKKTYSPSPNILKKLEDSIANIDKMDNFSKKELLIPQSIKEIQIDSKIDNTSYEDALKFKSLLVKDLHENLKLPEYGEVKVSFFIEPDGKLSNLKILDTKSQKNETYLKNELPKLTFPWFNQFSEVLKDFVIIFNNE